MFKYYNNKYIYITRNWRVKIRYVFFYVIQRLFVNVRIQIPRLISLKCALPQHQKTLLI